MALALRLAAVAIAAAVPIAAGAAPLHTARVVLPDGQVALLRYAGDIPPTLVMPVATPAPIAAMPPIFAAMDQMMARQAALMGREMALTEAAFDGGGALSMLPVSAVASGGACFEETSVVMRPGAPAQVTRIRSAGCGAAGAPAAAPATLLRPPARAHGPELIEASAR